MPTRVAIRAETMRRLGSYQTLTVATDPDVTDAAAQRKVISADIYSIDRASPHLGQGCLWVGRYGDGNKIRANSYVKLARAVLTPPSSGTYALRCYGYGTTASLAAAANAAAIQAAIRAISTSLAAVTVTGSSPYLIAGLPSSESTVELTGATTGSVSQGLASIEGTRPWSTALVAGDVVELLTKYPAHDENGLVGMNNLINQALSRLWFPDLLRVHSEDADSQQVVYSLESYPWLTSRSQIIRAYAPCRWEHTFAYTVPVTSHTLTLDVGFATDVTTASLAGSASASATQAALVAALGAAGATGTATVAANGTTRTVTVEDSPFADLALTVSTAATVTTTRERTDELRFVDGFRLRYDGEDLAVEWDGPWERGHTWYLEVNRPGGSRVSAQVDYRTEGTTWADVTTGLVDDLDRCIPDLHETAAVAHYLACRQLELYGPGQEREYWKSERMRAAMIAAQVKSLDLPTSHEPGFRADGLTANRYSQDKGFFSR